MPKKINKCAPDIITALREAKSIRCLVVKNWGLPGFTGRVSTALPFYFALKNPVLRVRSGLKKVVPVGPLCRFARNLIPANRRIDTSTNYHTDYLISNVIRKREFDEKIQG